MSHENASENPATSLMNLVRSLGPKYLQLANDSAEDLHQSIYKGRRQKKGLHVEITKEDVAEIFSLRYDQNLRLKDVATRSLRSAGTVGIILNRKHKMSANHPKHRNEH